MGWYILHFIDCNTLISLVKTVELRSSKSLFVKVIEVTLNGELDMFENKEVN